MEALEFYIRETQVEIWALSLTTDISLGKLHAHSEPYTFLKWE